MAPPLLTGLCLCKPMLTRLCLCQLHLQLTDGGGLGCQLVCRLAGSSISLLQFCIPLSQQLQVVLEVCLELRKLALQLLVLAVGLGQLSAQHAG